MGQELLDLHDVPAPNGSHEKGTSHGDHRIADVGVLHSSHFIIIICPTWQASSFLQLLKTNNIK
jgi:hypothetical protein